MEQPEQPHLPSNSLCAHPDNLNLDWRILTSLQQIQLSCPHPLTDADASDSDSAGSASCSSGVIHTPEYYNDEEEDEEDDEDDDDDLEASSTGYSKIPTASVSCEDFTASVSCDDFTNGKSRKGMMGTLKKRWKHVKKASARTASAGRSLSAQYFSSPTTETREERHNRLTEEWQTILPVWRKKRKTARVRTLAFRGVPASVRGDYWQAAIGNALHVSEPLFDVLKERARVGRMEYMKGRETLAKADGDLGGLGGLAEGLLEHERSAHKAIMLDIPRTFPDLSFFHAEGSHYEFALRDVLEAFLYLKPDVGYSQGMSFLAAVLLLNMDPPEAFSCFVNMLLHKSCFLHFFKIKMPEVRFYLTVHDRLFAEEMPALSAHFKNEGVESDLYMINWVMSLYCRALPLDLVARIWDVYVLDGDVAIFRSALGILRLHQAQLLKMKFEDMAYFLSHLPQDVDPDAVMQSIRSVRGATKKRLKDLFKDCQSAHNKDANGDSLRGSPSKSRRSQVT